TVDGVNLAAQSAAQVVGHTVTLGQALARNSVHVLRPEQLVPRSADIVGFQSKFGHQFALDTQVIVIDVRVFNAFRENDSGKDGQIGIGRVPTGQVADGLRARALIRVGGRTGEGRRCRGIRRAGRSTGVG